jgi:hypothetical protein
MNKRALSALAVASVLVAGLPGSTVPFRRPPEACSLCPRGRLQGKPGSRYCQRCGWFEAGERERVEAAMGLLGGAR